MTKFALVAFACYSLTGINRAEALTFHRQVNDNVPPVNTLGRYGPDYPLPPPDWTTVNLTPIPEPILPPSEPLPPEAPEPDYRRPPRSPYPTDAMLYNLRMCESTDNYRINTGNSFHGAYQYLQGTWNAVVAKMGLTNLIGVPVEEVSPLDQDEVTRWWWNNSNPYSQWPICSWRV